MAQSRRASKQADPSSSNPKASGCALTAASLRRPRTALVPVASSLVILVFVTCIFAVFAVHLFSGADKMNFGLAALPPFIYINWQCFSEETKLVLGQCEFLSGIVNSFSGCVQTGDGAADNAAEVRARVPPAGSACGDTRASKGHP